MTPVEQLIFDGQSFNNVPSPRIYPLLTLDLLTDKVRSITVTAINGTTYSQRSSTVAMRVDTKIKNSSRTVIVDTAGPSDILADLTAAQILSAAESYVTARKAAGAARVVGVTVPPSSSYSAGQDTIRQAYNTLLKASVVYDAVADIAALPHAANPADALYYSDGLHPTTALATEFAGVVAPVIRSLA